MYTDAVKIDFALKFKILCLYLIKQTKANVVIEASKPATLLLEKVKPNPLNIIKIIKSFNTLDIIVFVG